MEHIGSILGRMVLHKGEQSRDMVCPKHGPYVSRLYGTRTWLDCQDCLAEGWARKSVAMDTSRREESMARWKQILGESGIPARYQDCSVVAYKAFTEDQNKVLQKVEDYREDIGRTIAEGKNLVLTGWTGTGKTHFLSALILQALRENRSAIFITASKVVRAVRDTWGRGSQLTEAEVMRALAGVDLLAIDEIQETDAAERRLLGDVINDRYEKGKPTMISSNLDMRALSQHLGARAIDRLLDRGSTVCVMNWESFRSGAL
jgi:DNA replication protein DnaC